MRNGIATSRSSRARELFIAVALLSLGVQSCAVKHSAPEAGDTATHWLQRCGSDSSCGKGLRCLGAVCTAACASASLDACSSLHEQASCEPQSQEQWACDLVCADDASCRTLGPAYTCSAGRCRTPTDEAVSAPGTLLGAVPSESQAFLLSDPEAQAAVPSVFWSDDHWTVGWASPDTGLKVAHIDDGASIETLGSELAWYAFPFLAKGNDAQLLIGTGGSVSCGFRIIDTQNLELVSAATPCQGSAAAARIPGSGDWLLAWAEDDPVPVSATVRLARFRPSRGEWVSGPWTLGSAGPDGDLTVASVGDDAVVAWEGDTQGKAVEVRGVAAAVADEPSAIEPVSFAIAPTGSAALSIIDARGEALIIGGDGESLLSARLSTATSQVLASTPITDRRPGIAQVADNRYAVCYSAGGRPASGSQVMLVTLDAEGNRVGGPVAVAEGIENVGGCDLAWSGSALLVAWWDIALGAPRTTPTHSVVRARFMSVPD